MSAGKRAFGVSRRGDMVNGEAAVLQGCGKVVGEPLIVFDEQEAHGVPLFQPADDRRTILGGLNAQECVARQ
jgi:hypothetical protein